ncbi:MAG: proline dehydrogenase family protein [Candidatus Micrarchaeota archaeon]|nr:proline dehydrogenase family protein [Candidatus Micrarchaeota archaeon]
MGIGNVFERVFAGKWIAGARISDAIRRTRQLNALGESAIINYIGESLTDKRDIADAVSINLRLIREIRKEKLKASISLKLTALGLSVSKNLARKNYGRIVGAARRQGIFVWIDAESQDTIEDVISIYEGHVRKGGVGICLQSYLRRSGHLMQRLIKRKAVVRIVKGAYKESSKIAFETRKETTENYRMLMREAFAHLKEFTIATHDSSLIGEAMELNRSHRRRVTYAMLNGIRNRYAASLAAQGSSVAIYVPFGTRWIGYALRRLREESHLILVLRSLLGG